MIDVDDSIAAALERVAAAFPDDPAIVQAATTLTWQDFVERAGRLAGHLAARGVGAGDRVAIGTANRPEYLVGVLAAVKLGATPVNVNFRYRARELHHVLADSDAVAFVLDDALAEAWSEVRDQLPACATVLQVGGTTVDGAQAFDDALAGEQHVGTGSGDDAWLLYTGGTTGLPKAVIRSQYSVLETLRSLAFRTLGVAVPQTAEELDRTLQGVHDKRMVMLTASPLMHGTGLYGALTAFFSGGTVVLLPPGRLDVTVLAQELSRTGVTDLRIVGEVFALPFVDELEAAAARGEPYDLPRLRRIDSVGTVWSPATKQRLLAVLDVTLIDMIAATEGGPFAAAIADRSTPPDQLNAFRLLPGSRVLTVDDTDVVPGSGEVGVLAAPAPPGSHYAGAPQQTAQTFRTVDGVLYTVPGDLVTLEADGTLRLLGRGSGVINTGGEKVYAGEVEDVLRAHPDVVDAIVVGAPDPRWGNVVAAVVEARTGSDLSPSVLGEHVARTLASYKQPRRIVMVDHLHRTATGKSDLLWAKRLVADDGT